MIIRCKYHNSKFKQTVLTIILLFYLLTLHFGIPTHFYRRLFFSSLQWLYQTETEHAWQFLSFSFDEVGVSCFNRKNTKLVNIWKNADSSSLFGLNDCYMIRYLNYSCSLLMTVHWWWCSTLLRRYFAYWLSQYIKNAHFQVCLVWMTVLHD